MKRLGFLVVKTQSDNTKREDPTTPYGNMLSNIVCGITDQYVDIMPRCLR